MVGSHTSLPFRTEEEKKNWKKFKDIAGEQELDAATLLHKFIKTTVDKFDGRTVSLDKFTDPSYIPMPELFADISKASKYLIPMSKPELRDAEQWFYKMRVYAAFFQTLDDKQKARLIKENDTIRYEYAWRTVSAK